MIIFLMFAVWVFGFGIFFGLWHTSELSWNKNKEKQLGAIVGMLSAFGLVIICTFIGNITGIILNSISVLIFYKGLE